MLVDADAVAGGATQQLVDRHTEGLAGEVPQRLFDAAQHAGEEWAAAIESVAVHRLPVVDDAGRVLADQVRREFIDALSARERAPFEDRFTQADEAFVGVNFEEEPAWLDEERL